MRTRQTAADRLSDKIAKALTPPAKGNRLHHDGELPGFALRVTAAGAKAFVLNYRIHGHERRMTIGAFPTWSVSAARDRARELRREIDQGRDPLDERVAAREAPTIRDLWLEYESKHLPSKRARSADDDRSMWRVYILPKLSARRVADIAHTDVDTLHAEISVEKRIRANRVIEVLRKAMNLAIRWGWRTDNPCLGVQRNTEDKRERFLTEAEAARLDKALRDHKERSSCDAIRLLLLTGARKSEVLRATWDMFDLDTGLWVKPASTTKQKKLHRVPISVDAISLLKAIKAEKRHEVYVFPGRRKPLRAGAQEPEDSPLADIKRTWSTVCVAAAIKGARIHDLRHTFASMVISDKNPLPVVGALLGHSQAQTTQRYAHLYDDPLRQAVEAVGGKLHGTASGMSRMSRPADEPSAKSQASGEL